MRYSAVRTGSATQWSHHMNRLFLLAPLAIAACADVPADWGFTENDPRRALVPQVYADDAPRFEFQNDGTGLFFDTPVVIENDGCGLFYSDC